MPNSKSSRGARTLTQACQHVWHAACVQTFFIRLIFLIFPLLLRATFYVLKQVNCFSVPFTTYCVCFFLRFLSVPGCDFSHILAARLMRRPSSAHENVACLHC